MVVLEKLKSMKPEFIFIRKTTRYIFLKKKWIIKNKTIFFEFKSVATVPPTHFDIQILKDLTNANSLDQIKWIFNGAKNPPNFKVNLLNAIDNLPLTDDLARKFLGRNNATINDLKDLLELKFDDLFKLPNQWN